MTIRRGEDWGSAGALAPGAPVVAGDAELAALLDPQTVPSALAVGLLGGDLCRTVAGRGDEARLATPDALRLPVDVGIVVLDDGPARVFVAHVLAGRAWRGPVVAVMNAQYAGRWDVAPRAHPNDGRLDVLRATLGPADRWKAWRRLPLGTHVPHPAIEQRRVAETVVELPHAVPVRIDGRTAGRARRLAVRCVPDACTIVV